MSDLPRRTPLVRRTPLPRGTAELKRSPMPRTAARPRRAQRVTIPESIRRQALARDGKACQRCGVSIIGKPYSLHHRKPRSQGGEHTLANLVTVCGFGGDTSMCHGEIESQRTQATEDGWLVPRSKDPAAVMVRTWQHGWAWPGDEWLATGY